MNTKIGIIGGGQLGKMLIEAGIPWNLHFNVLDQLPSSESICGNLVKTRIEGHLHDPAAIRLLAEISDVITYEIENINTDVLLELEKEGKKVIPYPNVLKIIQDKGKQKEFFIEHNIPVVPFKYYKEYSSNEFNKEEVSVIKQCCGGYDGYGVAIKKVSDFIFDKNQNYIIEKYIKNVLEYSIIVACDQNGHIDTYPITQMCFNEQNMLAYQICPPHKLRKNIADEMVGVAGSVVKAFNSPGIFAVEMFLDESDNKIYVNEVSPRPHNSGHHTIEANITSQFTQLLHILIGNDLRPISMIKPSVMFNLLGPENHTGNYCIADPHLVSKSNIYAHLYGKYPSKPYRKLGHITILGDSPSLCDSYYRQYKETAKLIPANTTTKKVLPQVGVIMGSISDLPVMEEATKLLTEFGITYETHIISAHRTPNRMFSYAKTAQNRGIKVIIAGAGGAAHLPGMTSSLTNLPVIGVPIKTNTLSGVDSLHSIVQMPGGVPVATMAINGAKNAGLLAVKILALKSKELQTKLNKYNEDMHNTVMEMEKKVTTNVWI